MHCTAFIIAHFFRLLTTTDKYFNDSKDGKAKPETFDGSIKLQLVIVFLYGFLCVAILTGSVAIYIYKREEYEKGNNGYIYNITVVRRPSVIYSHFYFFSIIRWTK